MARPLRIELVIKHNVLWKDLTSMPPIISPNTRQSTGSTVALTIEIG